MEQFNLEELKGKVFASDRSFAIMPDGWIKICKQTFPNKVGLFSKKLSMFPEESGWGFVTEYTTIEKAANRVGYEADDAVIAELRPISELNFNTGYNYTMIPNLRHFIDTGEELHYLCSHLDMYKEWDSEPIEITKDLADYFVKDPSIERKKIYFTDCVLVKVGDYLGHDGSNWYDKAWYGFTIQNGKYYFLGKMTEADGKSYGKGSKLVEAVKEYTSNNISSGYKPKGMIKDGVIVSTGLTSSGEIKQLKEKNEQLVNKVAELVQRNVVLATEVIVTKDTNMKTHEREMTLQQEILKLKRENEQNEELKLKIQDLKDWKRKAEIEIETLTTKLVVKDKRYAKLLDRTRKAEQGYTKEQVAEEILAAVKKNIYEALNLEEGD